MKKLIQMTHVGIKIVPMNLSVQKDTKNFVQQYKITTFDHSKKTIVNR